MPDDSANMANNPANTPDNMRPTMTTSNTLQLTIQEFETNSLQLPTFEILRDFLDPGSTRCLEETARDLLLMIPNRDEEERRYAALADVYGEFWGIIEQLPCNHRGHMKLAQLLLRMSTSDKMFDILTGGPQCHEKGYTNCHQLFGEQLTEDHPLCPKPGNGDEYAFRLRYVGYHAFVANLEEHRVLCRNTCPTYAIWAMRDAFEGDPQAEGSILEYVAMAAAQYVLWSGQTLFNQLSWQQEVNYDDRRSWRFGPTYEKDLQARLGMWSPDKGDEFRTEPSLWTTEHLLGLDRWNFWKAGFKRVAADESYVRECREVSGKAAIIMDALQAGALNMVG